LLSFSKIRDKIRTRFSRKEKSRGAKTRVLAKNKFFNVGDVVSFKHGKIRLRGVVTNYKIKKYSEYGGALQFTGPQYLSIDLKSDKGFSRGITLVKADNAKLVSRGYGKKNKRKL